MNKTVHSFSWAVLLVRGNGAAFFNYSDPAPFGMRLNMRVNRTMRNWRMVGR